MTPQSPLNREIEKFCKALEGEFDRIPEERKALLLQLSHYLSHKRKIGDTPALVVICTHNSRRSHIAQLWLAVGADYFRLPEIQTFSGGTEATAFNSRAVEALKRIGFDMAAGEATENPVYTVRWRESRMPYRAFSKKYEDAPNPRTGFAAIMVCSEADAGCPIVRGCDFRIALPFDDPKAFDGTPSEVLQYDERVRQIGREMLFVLSKV